MAAAGEVVGLLHLLLDRAGGPAGARPGEPVAAPVAALAATVALAVSNVRLRERLRIESIRDPLTGLSNRRHLEEAFDREVARSVRSGSPIGVVMADLDHFKRFNDGEGHAAGDAVLREIGALLASSTRAGDLACRWGGEEFLLLFPSSGPDVTLRRADEIRSAVSAASVPFGGRLLGPLSASFGVSSYPRDGSTRETVVAAADAALYRAKAEGRDRVVAAGVRPSPESAGRP
jgi:diguanylate cyclase (GGDEF)-like protein